VNIVLASAPTSTPIPAATRGFGVVFLDVEQANTSSIEYFNGSVSLGKFFVPAGDTGQTQFLGVLFNAPVVTRIVITAGTAQVFNFNNNQVSAGPAEGPGVDLAVVDDFVYAEPVLNSASVSAASFSTASLAAESIAAAFGADLATGLAAATSTPLPTSLLNATLKVKDSQGVERAAPLFFVSPGQFNYQVPTGTAPGEAVITITSGDGRVSTGRSSIETISPGVFTANATGQGAAAALVLRVKANGDQVYEPVAVFDTTQQQFITTPIDLGPATDTVYLVLFGTGFRFRSALQGVGLKLGDVNATVAYAGGQTGLVGLDQVNGIIPRSLIGRGELDVVLTVDGKTANTVKVRIK
jgi:uncharacterized protein (TIGR03437 family)